MISGLYCNMYESLPDYVIHYNFMLHPKGDLQ